MIRVLRWITYKLTVTLGHSIIRIFARIHVLHPDRACIEGPCILASNHISHFDPPLISGSMRRKIDWMAMVELFKNKFVAAWLRSVDTFPVDREKPDRTTIRTALERLKHGGLIGIFPEGGIRDGATSIIGGAEMKPGLGMLAQIGNAPILPCLIIGSDTLYRKKTWLRFKGTRIIIAFGPLVHCEGRGREGRDNVERCVTTILQQLRDEVMETFSLTADDLPKSAQQHFNG